MGPSKRNTPAAAPRRPRPRLPIPDRPVVVETPPPQGPTPPSTTQQPTTASPVEVSASRLPPMPRDALRRRATAGLLMLFMLLGALPLFTGLGQQVGTHPREAEALRIADETWRHHQRFDAEDFSIERYVPISDQQPVLDEPPGQTWMMLAAFAPLDPDTATPESQRFRARLVGVAMSLVTLGGVYWAGLSLGGLRTAVLATLVVLANPLLVIHGRLATADATAAGWAMLSLASALWAIRPLRPAPNVLRQAMGWGLCGLALGLATLTRGPAVVPQVMLPLLLIGLIGTRRLTHLLGLVAAGALAALMTIPWAIYVHQQDPQVWAGWFELIRPPADAALLAEAIGVRSVALLVGSGVWGLLVVAAFITPWTTKNPRARRAMMIGWVWAVSAVGLVLVGPVFGETGWTDVVSDLLLAVPALAVATGLLLQRVGDIARAGGVSREWKRLALPTAALVLAASLVGPIVLYQRSPGMATMHAAYWLGAGLALLMIAGLATRWALRPFPGRAAACWALWTVVATTLVMIPASRGELPLPQAKHQTDHSVTPKVVPTAPSVTVPSSSDNIGA